PVPLDKLPAFNLGEMKFPDFKIGEAVAAVSISAPSPKPQGTPIQPLEIKGSKTEALKFKAAAFFKVIGKDQKIYGPVSGHEIEQWLADERITAASLAQKTGSKEWKPLATFAESPVAIPLPPPVLSSQRPRTGRIS